MYSEHWKMYSQHIMEVHLSSSVTRKATARSVLTLVGFRPALVLYTKEQLRSPVFCFALATPASLHPLDRFLGVCCCRCPIDLLSVLLWLSHNWCPDLTMPPRSWMAFGIDSHHLKYHYIIHFLPRRLCRLNHDNIRSLSCMMLLLSGVLS